MSRPDQVRDNDAIERDCISALIRPSKILYKTWGPDPDGEWHLRLCEGGESLNGDNAKFDFRFKTLEELEMFGVYLYAETAHSRALLEKAGRHP